MSGTSLAARETPAREAAEAAWGADVAKLSIPGEGCFTAYYPKRAWYKATCRVAPRRPYLPRTAGLIRRDTVGDGNDYALVTPGITNSAYGTFGTIKGLKSENDEGAADDYSLQLNSDFMSTAACNGASDPSNCLSWQQFIYSSGEQAVFMQYWLINYGNTCPSSDWFSYGDDCYMNSNAISVPTIAATALQGLALHGTASLNHNDWVKLTTPTTAYAVSGKDSVVDLATAWTGSEFNVIGDGGGSEATFNAGTSITVVVGASDGTTRTPSCDSDSGTTGETNNLNFTGSCILSNGVVAPYHRMKFIESN